MLGIKWKKIKRFIREVFPLTRLGWITVILLLVSAVALVTAAYRWEDCSGELLLSAIIILMVALMIILQSRD